LFIYNLINARLDGRRPNQLTSIITLFKYDFFIRSNEIEVIGGD